MVTIDLMSDIDCVTETFTLVLETFNGESSFYYLVPVQADEQVERESWPLSSLSLASALFLEL